VTQIKQLQTIFIHSRKLRNVQKNLPAKEKERLPTSVSSQKLGKHEFGHSSYQ